jgi:methyl-accepting chemotaxis protein
VLDYLNRFKIRTSLLLLISVLLSGLIIYGCLSYWVLQQLKIKGPYYEDITQSQNLVAELMPPPIMELYVLSFRALHETDSEILNKLIQKSISVYSAFEKRYQTWREELPESPLKSILMNQAYRYGREFVEIWRSQFLPAIHEGNKEKASQILNGELKHIFDEQRFAIQQAMNIAIEKNIATENEVEKVYYFGQLLTLLAWFATIFLSSFIAYLIGRSITNRLDDALKRMNSASLEINSRMDQQAQSVAQQSSSVHETTSAMDELNTSFQHTELLAQESSNRAKNALKVSEEGNQLTKQMLDEMLEHKEKVLSIVNQIMHLSEVINQIQHVASTINNLTNQTNILALNAAVQAAQVKQGSEGFSVIASEIRKLADESKKFVAHIDVLAGNIRQATDATVHIAEEGSKTVQDSIKLAQSSAKAFDTIISITTNSFEGAEQVSLNVKQQGQAVHQVLEAMEILNETAHQNLIGMQQVRAEVEKLNQLSQELKAII